MPKPLVRKPSRTAPKPTLRILLGAVIAVGPGKATLLEAIAETGSISAAARKLDMSYRRAWMLVAVMNRCFRKPVVAAATGGARGGGSGLTPEGEDVLRRYRALEARAQSAIRRDVAEFTKLLRSRPLKGDD